MNAKTPARYTVAGITDERSTCDCCGKSGLKRVVVLLDLDTCDFVFFGTTCAARNTGRDTIVATAKANGKVTTPADALIAHHERVATSMARRAHSIMAMANGCADDATRAEANRYYALAAESRRKADELRYAA